MFDDIKSFHQKYGIDYDGPPRKLPAELLRLRRSRLWEELIEYIDADTLEDQFDALIDLVYIALGTAYLQGFPFDEGWRRVHEANMKKVRAERSEQSRHGSTFDIVKPAGWTAPVLSDLVKANSATTYIHPSRHGGKTLAMQNQIKQLVASKFKAVSDTNVRPDKLESYYGHHVSYVEGKKRIWGFDDEKVRDDFCLVFNAESLP